MAPPFIRSLLRPHPASRRLRRGFALSAALLVAGCGGGSGGGSDTTAAIPAAAVEFEVVSGAGACLAGGCGGDNADGSGVGTGSDGGDGAGGGLGTMRNVRVTASKPDGSVLGSATLVDNLVSLYPRSYHGPFVLEFADDGSGTGSYFDEALAAWVPLAGHSLHVMVPVLTHHLSANLLTETAYRWAQAHRGGAGLETVMVQANTLVRDAFNQRLPAGWALDDITDYAVAVSDTTAANSIPDTHAGRYAVVMAAQALLAHAFDATLEAPALALADQLLADLEDDGSLNGSSSPRVAYDMTLPQVLGLSIAEAARRWGAPSMPAVPANIASLCVNPALYEPGASWVLNYQVSDGAGAVTTETDTMVVTGLKPFNGVASALEIVQTVAAPATDATTTARYISPVLDGGVLEYGSLATTSGGTTLTVFDEPLLDATITLDPPADRSAVGVVGSATVSQFDAGGALVSGPASASFAHVAGLASAPEPVTTATGRTLDTCHYSLSDRLAAGQPKLRDDWVTASGQGVVVKSVEYRPDGSVLRTRLLVDGFVDGEPVR